MASYGDGGIYYLNVPIHFEIVDEPVNASTYVTLVERDDLDGQRHEMTVEVTPTGADLVGFRVYVRLHADGGWGDPLYSGTDFDSTSIEGIEWVSAEGPHEVADGNTARFRIRNLGAIEAVRFDAIANGDGTATLRGSTS